MQVDIAAPEYGSYSKKITFMQFYNCMLSKGFRSNDVNNFCSAPQAEKVRCEFLTKNDATATSLAKDTKNGLSPLNPDPDKAIRLQREIRYQSNQQMNDMLRNTTPRGRE